MQCLSACLGGGKGSSFSHLSSPRKSRDEGVVRDLISTKYIQETHLNVAGCQARQLQVLHERLSQQPCSSCNLPASSVLDKLEGICNLISGCMNDASHPHSTPKYMSINIRDIYWKRRSLSPSLFPSLFSFLIFFLIFVFFFSLTSLFSLLFLVYSPRTS